MGQEPVASDLIPWDNLSVERQLELREAYGHYLDTLPPTCDLTTKNDRFRAWLEGQGVSYLP